MKPRLKTDEGRIFSPLEYTVIFIGACIGVGSAAGFSPAVLYDTAVEESFVRWCIERGVCPLFGGPAAFAGLWQGGAWIYLRTFFSWIGLTIPTAHLALAGLDALGITLVAATGARLGGRAAGLFAAAAAFSLHMGVDSLITSVHNSRFILFPGCLCISLCVRAAETGRLRFALLAAAAAAVAVNAHVSMFSLVFPVVYAGALCARRNAIRLAAAPAVYGVLTFAYAPGLWLYTLTHVFEIARGLPRGVTGVRGLTGIEQWGIAAVVTLIGTRIGFRTVPARRRLIDVLLAALVPGIGLYLAARYMLDIPPTDKYMLHLVPAVVVGFAPAIGAALTRARDTLFPRPESGVHRDPVWWGTRLAPFIVTVLFFLLVPGERRDAQQLTYADLRDVKDHLMRDLHWSLGDVYRNVKGPGGYSLVAAILTSSSLDAYDKPGPGGARPIAHVIKVQTQDLPAEVPPGWKVFRRPDGFAVVVVLTPTWMDWVRFDVCPSRTEAARCMQSGLTLKGAEYLRVMDQVPQMPTFRPREITPLVLQFNVSIPGDGTAQEIRIPADPHLCRGEIVAAPGGGTVLDKDGQRAVLRAAPGTAGETGLLVIEWLIGGAACEGISYVGHPPWFIEAPPEEARLMAGLLVRER